MLRGTPDGMSCQNEVSNQESEIRGNDARIAPASCVSPAPTNVVVESSVTVDQRTSAGCDRKAISEYLEGRIASMELTRRYSCHFDHGEKCLVRLIEHERSYTVTKLPLVWNVTSYAGAYNFVTADKLATADGPLVR